MLDIVKTYGYKEVWCVDFEFSAPTGNNPYPICLVALELISGRKLRIWMYELLKMKAPPYSIDSDSLFVAYYASAEMGCHAVLDWPMPSNILDLFTEFRNHLNGNRPQCGWGLLGALSHYGIDGIDSMDKEEMRDLVMRGGPWTAKEQEDILDYCETDVVALQNLLPAMNSQIDLPRALLRGRYMAAVARIEHVGIPIDVTKLCRFRMDWTKISEHLIKEIDPDESIYDGRTFKMEKFENWLAKKEIPWPQTKTGILALDNDTFRQMSKSHPVVAPIHELRQSLSQMRLNDLAVGHDGRNRCMLSAFRSRTGRNQPSNTKFAFGPSAWLRGLIKPRLGQALAYIDWSQQEFGIAAALSKDEVMLDAYQSGDPYLAFAKQAGAVPPEGTKQTHKAERSLYRACVLAVQYGMGEEALAQRISQPVAAARNLLRMHRRTYDTYWKWSDGAVAHAMTKNYLHTVFGWYIHVGPNANPRFLQNFLLQSNGSEMLRLACCLATEAGIRVCAPVHDAILIEAPIEEIDDAVRTAQDAMAEASRIVLDGFELRTDADLIRFPDRYEDERGAEMWAAVNRILQKLNSENLN